MVRKKSLFVKFPGFLTLLFIGELRFVIVYFDHCQSFTGDVFNFVIEDESAIELISCRLFIVALCKGELCEGELCEAD